MYRKNNLLFFSILELIINCTNKYVKKLIYYYYRDYFRYTIYYANVIDNI